MVFELTSSEEPRGPEGLPAPAVGGAPQDALGLRWPTCASCGEAMRFLFQLPSWSERIWLPEALSVAFVFQCESTSGICFPFHPDEGANAALALRDGGSGPPLEPPPDAPAGYPKQWLRLEPATEDTALLSLDENEVDDEARDAMERAEEASPRSKVGGVAVFPQGDATPTCCGNRMRVIAQLDGPTFGLRFGDGGVGHLFGCEASCEAPLRFGWQGY